MEIKGYKAFNKDKQNRYGVPFEEGKSYKVNGIIKFGNYGNGYHFCKNLCDVFRYVDNSEEVFVAEVTGTGKYAKYDDEYYGYFDMYSIEEIRVDRFLSRLEIIARMLKSDEDSVKKFLTFYRLTEDEKLRFISKYRRNDRMLEWILYFQFGIKDIYEKKGEERKMELRKVLAYEQRQNNNQGSQGE